MSWKAVSWANEQDTESPSAHLVLLQLANIAAEDGVVRRLDVDYLARVARQSRASVFRKLSLFEKAGVLTRETIGFSADGAKIVGARLWLDRVYRPMQSAHDGEDAEAGENVAAEAFAEGGQSQIETACQGGAVSPRTSGSLTAETASPYGSNPEDIIYPPTPHGGAPEIVQADDGDNLEAQFAKFQASYPFDATMRVAEARLVFAGLTVKDRTRAVRAAGEYALDLQRRGSARAMDAARWLRGRRFEDVEAVKGGQARAQGLDRPRVFVAQGTRAWDAWLAHKGARSHPTTTDKVTRKTGWWFESLWPPGADPPEGAEGENAA